MTIVFPGPIAWNAANWVVRGFFSDARPHLAAAAPALADDIARADDTSVYALDLAAGTAEQFAQLRALIEAVLADHPPADDPTDEAAYIAKLGALDELAARAAAAAAPAPAPAARHTVDGGRVVVAGTIDAGVDTGFYRGHLSDRPAERRLITISGPHQASYVELRAELALSIAGIAELEFVGRTDGDWGGDCIVEVEPAGAPALAGAPVTEAAAVRIAIDVAAIAAAAHANKLVIGGIRPDLIYVDGGAVMAIAPRAPRFIHTARAASSGVPALAGLYDPETVRAVPLVAASDVFALCASVIQLVTGVHPFGARPGEQIAALASGRPVDWAGSPALGAILRRGLARDPRDRPSASELGAALAALPG